MEESCREISRSGKQGRFLAFLRARTLFGCPSCFRVSFGNLFTLPVSRRCSFGERKFLRRGGIIEKRRYLCIYFSHSPFFYTSRILLPSCFNPLYCYVNILPDITLVYYCLWSLVESCFGKCFSRKTDPCPSWEFKRVATRMWNLYPAVFNRMFV